MHRPPPVPQANGSVPGMHVAPAQQPVGHEAPSHTQRPPLQRWPPPHAREPPQEHAPLTQESASVGSQAVHVPPRVPQAAGPLMMQALFSQQPFWHRVASQAHAPPTHRWPRAQARWPPQEQAPSVQPSAEASQATHAAPAVPQEVTD
jgi:hypothetical protein